MTNLCEEILDEYYANAKGVLGKIACQGLEDIVSLLLEAEKIFVLGLGHSGMIAKVLSMKLNHVGLRAYTVYDEVNPPFGKRDLFVAVSQSGETDTILSLARKARTLGGKVAAITCAAESSLGELSKIVLQIDNRAEHVDLSLLALIGEEKHQNLSGTLFGFNLYVLFYTLVIMIAQRKNETGKSIDQRHQNLQ